MQFSTVREFTFAGIDALGPRVIKIRIIFKTAVLEPSTTQGTTTDFPGFPEEAAFGAHGTGSRHGTCWYSRGRGGFLSIWWW